MIVTVYLITGPISLAGAAVALLIVPIQIYLGSTVADNRMKIAERTDKRICMMSEIIRGIKVIKMYTWEKLFQDIINNLRR